MVDIVVYLSFLLGEFDFFNLDRTGWKRYQRFSIRSLHVFRTTENQGLENGLYHIESSNEIFRLERDRDKCLPKGEIGPRLNAEKMHETEKILEAIDNWCAGKYPAMLGTNLITSFCGF